MKILVGMSGGVDSSVAAMLLKEQGHEVIGAIMSIWGKDGLKLTAAGNKNACYGPDEKEDIEEAKKIAKEIGIPLHVFDCVEQYEKIVLENFKEEYLAGRTPNPCIWCNSLIKFDVLPFLAKQAGIEFDKFATGHYARIELDEKSGRYLLKKGVNPKKDQSYFIYRLRQDQLANIIFPLGSYTKEEIRTLAKERGLKVFDKPDSQDFYSGDYNELLEVKEKEGRIVDTEGKILGKHNGIWNYTIGQRKGLGISSTQPLYVVRLDKEKNEVVVGFEDKTFQRKLVANRLSLISTEKITEPIEAKAKVRSTQTETEVTIKPISDEEVEVEFYNLQKSIAPGQSIVFYNGETVIGGGIIDRVL